MSDKLSTRYIVECDGKLLRLFSVIERKESGDLVIKLNHSDFYREFEKEPNNNIIIKNQKYSVHCSPNSIDKINSIVHTLDLSNGETIRTSHYTKALKQNDLFASLYIKRCPDLNKPKYETDLNKIEIINLGSYDPLKCFLYYMIVIGNKGHDFNNYCESDINSKTVQYKNFSLTVLWSFAIMPSNHTSAISHLLTLRPEDLPEIENETQKGLTQLETFELFRLYRSFLDEEFKKLLIDEDPSLIELLKFVDLVGFWKNFEDILG